MKTRVMTLTFLAGILATVAGGAHATIEQLPGAGFHAGALLDDAEQFTNAMVNFSIDHEAGEFSGKAIDRLRRVAKTATLARFEYTWEAAGQTHTIVVHSRSGQPIETILGPRNGSGSGSESFTWSEEQVNRELGEVAYYPRMQGHLRGTAQYDEESELQATTRAGEREGTAAGDAEFKALRTLEAEIKAGRIPRGGTLLGTVSKKICPSCSTNFGRFSEAYDVHGKVYYLLEAREQEAAIALASSPAEEHLIRESVVSNRGLYASRNRYIDRAMQGPAAGWQRIDRGTWVRRTDLRLLAEAESGSILAEGCP